MSTALRATCLARRLAACPTTAAWSAPRAAAAALPPARRSVSARAEGGESPAGVVADAATAPAPPAPASDDADVPLSAKLDIRVGVILEVEVHPDADG